MTSKFFDGAMVVALLLGALLSAVDPTKCLAQAPSKNSTDPLEDPNNPLIAEFRKCDADADGLLTEAEYQHRIGFGVQDLHREFIVFDADGDSRISLAEFLTVPVGQPDEQRGTITDPVIVLSKTEQAELGRFWKQWDKNEDAVLSRDEFAAAEISSRVKGLEWTRFADWDLDRNGNISREEVARVLDVAFGVCVPDGTMLRSKTGQVVDWVVFLRMKTDAKGFVSRDEYFRVMGPTVEDRDAWFRTNDKNNDGRFDFLEFSTGGHRTDPVGMFLNLDVDLNGRVSRAELASLPDGWRQMAQAAFRAFAADGELSLRDYQLMPHSNLVASWSTAVDSNNDGTLTADEFQFQKGLPLAAITSEYFRKLDLNRDQRLSLDEWLFQTNHPAARFQALDKDSSGSLNEAEFTAEGSMPAERMTRDFKLFDTNHDGRMELAEFFTLPYWIPDDQRGGIPDPVIAASKDRFKEVSSHWAEWDRDSDGNLNAKEFTAASIGQLVPGLESTKFSDWDLDRNGKLTREEANLVLEIAYGVRTPEGKMLRAPSGRVVDWQMFRRLPLDRNGFTSRGNYFQLLGGLPDDEKEKWFRGTDQNQDGKFNYDEFALSNHRTDPVGTFLHLDADLNARLTLNELQTLPPEHQPIVNCLFPGFDDDKDGVLSLYEFQMTPIVNMLADWRSAQDTDGDARLSRQEFQFHPGIPLAALTSDYFRRLDLDKDGFLNPDEFPFNNDQWDITVTFEDDTTKRLVVPGYPIICSPEISPDSQWIAVDGWKSGQSNVTAHIFLVKVDTEEVRDLGIGCIPNWSGDGRKIGLSKYGQGVFIRNVNGPAQEESIDRQGWAIMFAPDGLKTAYVRGGNLVVHNVKTGEKRPIYPEGKSPYRYIEHNFTWSPDSERIVFKGHRAGGTIDIGIATANAETPDVKIRSEGSKFQSDFSWLADGRTLMFPYFSGGPFTQIYQIDPDGNDTPVRYPRQPENKHTGGLCWSRDGKIFVFMCKR